MAVLVAVCLPVCVVLLGVAFLISLTCAGLSRVKYIGGFFEGLMNLAEIPVAGLQAIIKAISSNTPIISWISASLFVLAGAWFGFNILPAHYGFASWVGVLRFFSIVPLLDNPAGLTILAYVESVVISIEHIITYIATFPAWLARVVSYPGLIVVGVFSPIFKSVAISLFSADEQYKPISEIVAHLYKDIRKLAQESSVFSKKTVKLRNKQYRFTKYAGLTKDQMKLQKKDMIQASISLLSNGKNYKIDAMPGMSYVIAGDNPSVLVIDSGKSIDKALARVSKLNKHDVAAECGCVYEDKDQTQPPRLFIISPCGINVPSSTSGEYDVIATSESGVSLKK